MSFPVCQNMIPHPVYANSLPYSSGTGNTLVSDDSSGYCTIQSKVPCDFEPNDKKNRNVVRVTVPTSNLEVSFHNYVNKPIYVHSSGSSQQPSTVISRDQSIVEHSSNSTTTVTTTRSDINTCTCSQLQPSSVKMLSKNKGNQNPLRDSTEEMHMWMYSLATHSCTIYTTIVGGFECLRTFELSKKG